MNWIILFLWVNLFENNIGDKAILFSLGGGLDLRLSLFIKAGFFFANFISILQPKRDLKIYKHFFILSSLILISCASVFFVNNSFFFSSLSVSLHIILGLNIALFIYLHAENDKDILRLLKGLRTFGFINALLVIISFFFPHLSSVFESGVVEGGVKRAFGVMGDEVAILLVFFAFDAFLQRKYFLFFIFSGALLCTGSIGASISFVCLFGIYLFTKVKNLRNFFVSAVFVLGILIGGFFSYGSQLQNISVVKRITNNIQNPKEGNGNLRVASLLTAMEMVKEKPIFGYGYGTYQNNVRERYKPIFVSLGLLWRFPSAMVILGSSFNPYVQMVCEAGIIGLLVFIYFVSRCIIFAKSVRNKITITTDKLAMIPSLIYFWFIVFFFTAISANWLLPSSFLFILFVTLHGILTVLKNDNSPTTE